jgi:peptide/nickel transport system substrate-binding protein
MPRGAWPEVERSVKEDAVNTRSRLSRRHFVGAGMTALLAAIAAGCADQSVPVPTKAPDVAAKPTTAAQPAGAAPAQPTAAPAAAEASVPSGAQGVPQVPRNETLIMSVSDTLNQFTDVTLQNPFVTGALRTGWHFAFEPLFFYNPFWSTQVSGPAWNPGKNGEIPYLAEGYEYSGDFRELTVKLRPGVTWSDGKPFTANDVVFTITMLRDNAPRLTWSFDMKHWVKEIAAVNEHTVKFTLNNPNPHFMSSFFMWHMDIGFPMVPEHIFKGQDYTTFTNYDLAKGWPITTGPWKLVHSSPEQKIWDRRDDWWGAKTGFRRLPSMKRIVVVPRVDDAKKAQLLASGQVDTTHNIQPADTEVALSRNPKLQVFTADGKAPYGSLDWWTNAMGFNCSKPPFDDAEMRWAINHAIDRKQIIDVGFKGAGQSTVLPFPAYPAMKPYFDSVKPIMDRHPVDAYNPEKTAQIFQKKGYTKDGEGFWTKDGTRFSLVLMLPAGFFQHFAPVIVTQLRRAGIDASFKSPSNASSLMAQGDVDAFLNGHGGGIRDPYRTLFHFHGSQIAPTGQEAPRPHRWKNAEFDSLVDQMGQVPSGSTKFMELYNKAMEIWIPELPVIPTVQWYLICPVNTAYWKGWPTEANPYTAPAMWHRGAATLVINSLEPAGA